MFGSSRYGWLGFRCGNGGTAYGSWAGLGAYRSTVDAAAEGAKLPARLSGRVKLTSELVSKPAPPARVVGNAWGFSPWAFNSGHLIASPGENVQQVVRCSLEKSIPSSKSSVNRFLVNFQITNATMPKNAIPPATERPTIVEVLTPFEPLSLLSAPEPALEEVEEPGAEPGKV